MSSKTLESEISILKGFNLTDEEVDGFIEFFGYNNEIKKNKRVINAGFENCRKTQQQQYLLDTNKKNKEA